MGIKDLKNILEFCDARCQWLIETTIALVQLESPTANKSAVDRCGFELARRLRTLGAVVDAIESETTGNHIRATFGKGPAQLLLLGHFDTVWPAGQIEHMPLRRQDSRLYGPGVFDMKAGIVIGMLALSALKELGLGLTRRVVMLLTADEELGSKSSRTLIESEACQSDAVCVLEPALPGGGLKTSRKGTGEFELTIRGVSAHAGLDPEKGASAISELAAQIVTVDGLAAPEQGRTVNVGVVEGGSRANVVAEQARAIIDVRVETVIDAKRFQEELSALKPQRSGTSLNVQGGFSRLPLERTKEVVSLYEMAREVARQLGHTLSEGPAGGASDGNLTAALGVPTLDGLGAVGDGAHARHEHVEIDQLTRRAALVAGLLLRIDAT
jgi:glutamate carboxypeptidase